MAWRKTEMDFKLFAAGKIGDAASAIDFIANILQESTEHSIISKKPDEAILLCNGERPAPIRLRATGNDREGQLLHRTHPRRLGGKQAAGDPGSRAEKRQMGMRYQVAAQERRAPFFSLVLTHLR